MRVFVTPASGWTGRGLVPELTAAGYKARGRRRRGPICEVAEVFEADRTLTSNMGRQGLLPEEQNHDTHN